MTVWLVFEGKKEIGRVLGRTKDDATKTAESCWPRRKLTVKPLKK
jgi:hypothetical protein